MVSTRVLEAILPALQRHTVIRSGGDLERARELLQETSLRVLEHRLRRSDARAVLSYAKRIVDQLIRDGWGGDALDPQPLRLNYIPRRHLAEGS